MGGWTDSRSSAQCGDAFEQVAAIADVGDAKVFQILVRQSQEDRVVDMVLAKENLIVTIQGTRSADGYLYVTLFSKPDGFSTVIIPSSTRS
jgi:hypothetical protein